MRVAIFGVVVMVLMGCLSPRSYCDEVGASACAHVYRCADTDAEREQLARSSKDQNDCTRILRLQLGCEMLDEQRMCSNSRYSAAKAGTCIAKLQQLSCEQTFGDLNCIPCE